jgi:carboxypeptidase Taq
MLEDGFNFDTLPTLWNQKYKEYLGVDVPNDKEGVLQDVHWTSGVGYFFSYALGNAYSAQIYNAMKKDLNIDELLESGNIKPIINWLKSHMYKYGSMLKPKELIKAITGEEFNPEYYCKYLEEKYSKIYQL